MTIRHLILAIALGATAFATAADHGHDHAGHDHGKEAHATDLGSAKAGAWTVKAEVHGDIVAGKDGEYEIVVEPAPKSVRAWIGNESAKGSTKAKGEAEKEPGHFHAHIAAPATIEADAQLWIAVEGEDGTTAKASLPLKPAAKTK